MNYLFTKSRLLAAALLFLFLPAASIAQNTVDLSGVIHDSDTDHPVPYAVIKVIDTGKYDIADKDGFFSISSVEKGVRFIEISHLGYRTETIELICGIEKCNQLIIHLTPLPVQTGTVIISGTETTNRFKDLEELTSVLKGKKLQRDLGTTLASTLKNEVGISMRSMGPAPSRPVIRGLSGDRVSISEDGMETNDLSSTSPDHAVTIEPFTVKRIEVIRGPKVLLHSSTTIGGLVNVVRNDIPPLLPQRINGSAGIYGESANSGKLGAGNITIPLSPFALNFELSGREAGNLNTPTGTLDNTNLSTVNYSAGVSLPAEWGYAGVSIREFNTDYGIPGGFIGGHPNGVDIEMLKRTISAKSDLRIGSALLDKISLSLGRTYYSHTEYENSGAIGSEFVFSSYNGSAVLHNKGLIGSSSGSFGSSFEYRDLEMGGYVFTPPTSSLRLSGFYYENLNYENLNIQFSGRYDYKQISPRTGNPSSRIGIIRDRNFHTFSAAISAAYETFPNISLGAGLSRSARIPTIEELFNEGPHLAAYSYETGNPGLESEWGIGTELFAYYSKDETFAMITGFYNYLPYYIIPRNTGEINYQTLLPVYSTQGVEAIITGLEFRTHFHIFENIDFESTFSYTYGELTETNAPLPMIPPLKWNMELLYRAEALSFGIRTETASDQERTDSFEEHTAGYFIMDVFGQYIFETAGFVNSIAINFDNIFDREYRNHLSRIKSISPEAGQNVRLIYRVYF